MCCKSYTVAVALIWFSLLATANLVPGARAFSVGSDRTPDTLEEIKNRNQKILVPGLIVRMRSSSMTVSEQG